MVLDIPVVERDVASTKTEIFQRQLNDNLGVRIVPRLLFYPLRCTGDRDVDI